MLLQTVTPPGSKTCTESGANHLRDDKERLGQLEPCCDGPRPARRSVGVAALLGALGKTRWCVEKDGGQNLEEVDKQSEGSGGFGSQKKEEQEQEQEEEGQESQEGQEEQREEDGEEQEQKQRGGGGGCEPASAPPSQSPATVRNSEVLPTPFGPRMTVCAPGPSRVDQRVAIGTATAVSVLTRRKDAPGRSPKDRSSKSAGGLSPVAVRDKPGAVRCGRCGGGSDGVVGSRIQSVGRRAGGRIWRKRREREEATRRSITRRGGRQRYVTASCNKGCITMHKHAK